MKKYFIILICTAMLPMLFACSDSGDDTSVNPTSDASEQSEQASSSDTQSGTLPVDGDEKIIVAEDTYYYNLVNLSDFGFNIVLFSEMPTETLEYISAEGEGFTSLDLTVNDETYSSLKNETYRGYYTTLLGFIGKTEASKITINKINIKRNGKNLSITPKYPITHSPFIDEENDRHQYVSPGGMPLMIMSVSVSSGNGDYAYGFSAAADISVTGFRSSGMIEPCNTTISVSGTAKGDLGKAAPVEIKKGSSFKIMTGFKYKDSVEQKIGFGVFQNLILDYKLSDGSEHSAYVIYTTQSVSNKEEAHALLDYYLSREGA